MDAVQFYPVIIVIATIHSHPIRFGDRMSVLVIYYIHGAVYKGLLHGYTKFVALSVIGISVFLALLLESLPTR